MREVRHIETTLRLKDNIISNIQDAHELNRIMSVQVVGNKVYILASIDIEVIPNE